MRNVSLLIILTTFCLSSCSSFNPFESEGEYIEKRIDINGVSAIENLNTFQIQIIQDDEEFIVLKGGENLISKTNVKVADQQLIIDHSYNNKARNFDLITAEVHLKEVNKITCSAPANISSINELSGNHLDIIVYSESQLVEMNLNLEYDSMKFHSLGSATGGYKFSGICPNAHYILNGVINIKAGSLQSNNITLAQNGIGEAHVWAKDKLSVSIYSSGNIYYTGTPEISVKRVQVNNQNPTGKVIEE
ncbi:GIN domain-containing protein [Marinifilum fragile]|uniref:GIN domain-containing protein n=1 Tax=Marinifilum fragile TaxID=570161 RepID=UPI0006D12D2F|nr:DUF2807 domain-containing protein [Marinifilum fragile]